MNLVNMIKQAGAMQAKMAELQAKLDSMIVNGQAGAGIVKVTMTGKFTVKSIEIDPSILKSQDKEIVEDLILAALADAKAKAEAISADQMKELTAGLPLPAGLKLPF